MSECGKRIGDNLWLHKSGLRTLPSADQARVGRASVAARQRKFSWNVIKLAPDSVSLLDYPGFFTESNPALRASLQVSGSTVQLREYGKNGNPPVLHRVETFLPLNHPQRAKLAGRTQRLEAKGYFKAGTSTIGTLRGHRDRLKAVQ